GEALRKQLSLSATYPDSRLEIVTTEGNFLSGSTLLPEERGEELLASVPRKGYRLNAQVTWLKPEPAASTAQKRRTAKTGIIAAAATLLLLTAGAVFYGYKTEPTDSEFDFMDAVNLPIGINRGDQFRLSGDGKMIAYTADSKNGTTDLFIASVDNPEHVSQLTATAAAYEYSPAWSPDKSALAFIRIDDSRCVIVIITIANGAEGEISTCAKNAIPSIDWSPDGSHIAFIDQNSLGISTISIESRETKQWTKPNVDDGPLDSVMRFSPDSKKIAFIRRLSWNKNAIFTTSEEHLTPRQVSPVFWAIRNLDWISGNKEIIYKYQSPSNMGLHITNIETGENKNVLNSAQLKELGLGDIALGVSQNQRSVVMPFCNAQPTTFLQTLPSIEDSSNLQKIQMADAGATFPRLS
ncbi:MAG: hypothetical protein MJA83_14455, partial [Gammaproteobacteria bacterium]|nr:hypothetical protein [Gammaproteobacteria bacterium]